MSTIKKIHSQTSNCEACQAVSVKMITNEEIQSPNLSCKDCVLGQYDEICKCKEDIPIKRLAQIQSVNAGREKCNKALILNSEETLLSTFNYSGEALVSDQRQSLNRETNIASEGCPTNEEICSRSNFSDALLTRMSYVDDISSIDAAFIKKLLSDSEHTLSQSQSSNCQALHGNMLNNDENHLSVLNICSGAVPTKTVADQSQSQSCKTHACQGCSTKMSTYEEIHSRSRCSDALFSVEDMSSIDEAVISKLLSDSAHTMCQGQSSSKRIACEFIKNISTNGSLLSSSRFDNKLLSTNSCSCHTQSLCCESSIPEPPAETSDEETYSRSSICEALLKTLLSTDEETHLASTSYSEEALSTKMLSDHQQLLRCGTRVAFASPPKMSTTGSQNLKPVTDSPNAQIRAMGALSPLDPSSYSRPELAIIKHISLNLNVNFETHVLSGQAKLDFDVLQDINELILDASNLKIESIQAEDGAPLLFDIGQHLPNMGSKLTIILPQQLTAGKQVSVTIKYSTDPQASALQWLDPEQTSGKKHPYLFSQCQPIHARSILPCQDTPAVKFTYDAEVTAPEEFTVLMSALRGEQKSNKTTFRQPMPLPSYLVALAVGVLESRTLGPRSKVWSEKEEIERSAWEFSETEKYLQAAEKLCGPYEWTQYDLLVLPPSFPYGGMENPCLTFVTPTLLAGDRSQADVIVHEIMHSWTGNLVTNRNFEHFWLNEGLTVFLERKVGASLINDSVEAKRSRDFQSLLGLQELNEAIQVFGSSSPLTNLVVNLDGIHPDDAFSRVPYEKGSLFLRYLEDQAGGPEVFDDFLRAYLTKFRKKSLDTIQFKDFFVNYFKDNEALKNIDWDLWLYRPGMPPVIPAYDTTMTKAIMALIVKIDDPSAKLSHEDVETFTPHQMIHILQQLIDRPALSPDRLATLGTEYRVNGNKNTEILYRWLRLCIRSRDQSKISEVFNFVNSQGRMKYVRPIYRDLYAWEDIRQQAIDNFLKNEKYMMHVSAYTLRKDLHLVENENTE